MIQRQKLKFQLRLIHMVLSLRNQSLTQGIYVIQVASKFQHKLLLIQMPIKEFCLNLKIMVVYKRSIVAFAKWLMSLLSGYWVVYFKYSVSTKLIFVYSVTDGRGMDIYPEYAH